MDAGNHGFENLLAQDQQPREDTHAGGVDAISSRATTRSTMRLPRSFAQVVSSPEARIRPWAT
jgi:hypothetical protein